MKRIKRLLPILTAVLLILPGMTAQAEKNVVEKQSIKTLEGTVTMTLEGVQSLEATLKASAGTQGGTVTIQSATVSCKGDALCMDSDNKIFVASSGEPVTLTIETVMKFSKAGTYVLELDGGITDEEGNYEDYSESKDFIKKIEITAGDTTASGTTNNQTSSESTKDDNKIEIKFDVDYSELEEALNNVTEAINSNEELKNLQELLVKTNEALALLDSSDQQAVDEAAVELQESLDDLGSDVTLVTENEEEAEPAVQEIETKKGIDGSALDKIFKLAKIILPILAILIFIAAAIYFWRKAKKKAPDYDGAPMVDYDIEDDDE